MPPSPAGSFRRRGLSHVTACALVLIAAPAAAQFQEDFAPGTLVHDASALEGWAWFAGDGEALIDVRGSGEGYVTIAVDATRDRRNVWWAVVKRRVSEDMDLERLARPGQELRIQARIRVSHAPRRVNLHLNTQRTTDFHSHLVEFDIPDTEGWHTISMTTRGFPARPGDTVFGQLALIDWGRDRYRVDVDEFRVDVVDAAAAGPDRGEAVPYHPPVPDPPRFERAVPVTRDAVIDLESPSARLAGWGSGAGADRRRLLSVGGGLVSLLAFDLSGLAGREVAGHGLLELTTRHVLLPAESTPNAGLLRVVEITGGDPDWTPEAVSAASLRAGAPLAEVLNPQMIIDWPPAPGDGARTLLTISRPVLQRLVDGRSHGLALTALGPLSAAFYASGPEAGGREARLHFDLAGE